MVRSFHSEHGGCQTLHAVGREKAVQCFCLSVMLSNDETVYTNNVAMKSFDFKTVVMSLGRGNVCVHAASTSSLHHHRILNLKYDLIQIFRPSRCTDQCEIWRRRAHPKSVFAYYIFT